MTLPTKRQTIVINLLAGPGAGKTTIASYLFYKLKTLGYLVEYVPEYAKTLVWTKQFDRLNNQYLVSSTQYEMIKALDGEVDWIITDGPISNGLFYNRHNRDNNSNPDKTEAAILRWSAEFNNLNIFLDRANITYEKEGRYQDETEARQIDAVLQLLLRTNGITYQTFPTLEKKQILEYILQQK